MNERILSAGIDIGTTTTQVVISQFELKNMASPASVPRIHIDKKEIIYRSPIHFTPLQSNSRIDSPAIKELILKEYHAAGVDSKSIRTGAIIITGETARKENSSELLHFASQLAGDFVVATAGPDLEAIIAGKGSGALKISQNQNNTIANIDIGGGTTNIVVIKNGHTIDTVCLDVGGRLVRLQSDGKTIEYISPKLKEIIKHKGLALESGEKADIKDLKILCDIMAEAVGCALRADKLDSIFKYLIIGKPLSTVYELDAIVVSGGVADFVYQPPALIERVEEAALYGDIGPLLGQSMAASKLLQSIPLVHGQETIGATVVGAGVHTTEISGSTIHYNPEVLPVKNVPVLKLVMENDEQYIGLANQIKKGIEWFDAKNGGQLMALAFKAIRHL